ncbi:MAG: 3'-5' exonuclease [Ignavibacteriales bacterium]|nr:MAG: 3'-5' exonuclease [Ignavibacteriales bacterium]
MPLVLTRPLVFFDLETTGTDISQDRIVEISILKLHPDSREETLTTKVNPGIPIPTGATAVHGITDKDVADKPTFSALASALLEILDGSDLCGYNLLKFDFPLLRMEFARYGVEFDITGIRLIDPMRIFMKKEPRDLTSALKFYCNEELTDAHTAEADTIAAKKILLSQTEKYSDLPTDVEGLSNYTTEGQKRNADITGKLIFNETNEIVYNFGKHIGKKVTTHPDYAAWMLNSDFPADTKTILRNLLNI